MLKYLLVLFFISCTGTAFAQILNQNLNQGGAFDNRFQEDINDTLVNRNAIKVSLSGKTKYTDYKVISYARDTTYIDTTMSIDTYYRFNYTNRDNFGKMPFPNEGQTFNTLAYDFESLELYPKIGAEGKQFGFFTREDVNYYYVPTPTSQLTFRTGMEQGQIAEGLFAFNISPQFSSSITFKGTRSLGKYRHSLSELGNFRYTVNFNTKNLRYYFRGHIVAQSLKNDENGGLPAESIENFESGSGNFQDRGRIEVNFEDATSNLRGNRYYFDHYYKLWQGNDSLSTRKVSHLSIGQVFEYDRQHFEYEQDDANNIFGVAYIPTINDDAKQSKLFNEVYINLRSPFVLGDFKISVSDLDYTYGYNRIIIGDENIIEPELTGNLVSLGAEWKTDLNKFNLHAKAASIITGNVNGYFLEGAVTFGLDSISTLYARAATNNRAPDFNYQLFQSDYKSYNWQNNFSNEQVSTLQIGIKSPKWSDLDLSVNNIDNYLYFSAAVGEQPKPVQASESVQYLKLKWRKEFRFGKFALDNSLIYQQVAGGEEFFQVPDLITRNSFYFSSSLFKGRPLYLQTGITFNYFTEYNMPVYNPVLGEFAVQTEQKFGGFPMFDFFINARIQRTRLYLLFEHFNSDFTGYNYYSAPTVPYRDSMIRFGIVWNFFI
ncbi:MAG: putative porin [Flavobacteriaceae bacterium]|nr:putative porin [Flavobacteriaceae bacterium]